MADTAQARHPMAGRDEPSEWGPVGNGTPTGAWLETKRDGEGGTNLCFCRIMAIGDEPEWIDRDGYSTLINPGSFAPPTHWRWPQRNETGDPVKAPKASQP